MTTESTHQAPQTTATVEELTAQVAKAQADAAAAAAAAEAEEAKKDRMDMLFGLTLAVFAAVLAVCDLGGGKYGDDEILAANETAKAYAWYNTKGTKQELKTGESEFLQALLLAGAVEKDKEAAVKGHVETIEKKIAKYSKEKKEILLGSEAVGKENWIQDIDGELGQVTGAKQWEDRANKLGAVGDVYDSGTLFLQMCLVLGAIGIVVKADKLKWTFYAAMIGTGVIGSVYTYLAYTQAWKIV
jgi:hypothetical protein